MKPAHCWKVLGPRPLTSLSCSRFINGPFFSRHSIIFLALFAFRPAICLTAKFTKYIYYHWTVINTSPIHYKYMHYCRKAGLQNLEKLNTARNFANKLPEQSHSLKKDPFSEFCRRNPLKSTKLGTAIHFCTYLTSKPGTCNLWSVGYFCNTNSICHVLWPAPSCPLQETTWEEGSGQINCSCENNPLSAIVFQWYCNTLPQHEGLMSAIQKEGGWQQLAFLTWFNRFTQLVPFLSAALEIKEQLGTGCMSCSKGNLNLANNLPVKCNCSKPSSFRKQWVCCMFSVRTYTQSCTHMEYNNHRKREKWCGGQSLLTLENEMLPIWL